MITKCSCQHCKKEIQFTEDDFKSGKKIKCPHCEKETALSIPPVEVREMEKFISIESIPAWFALIAGIIYAVGFLIQFTFLSSYGIKESVTEVFKAKYIYVGLLCLQFPISAGLMFFASVRKKLRVSSGLPDHSEGKTRVYFSSTFLMVLLLFTFYLMAVISEPGFFHVKQSIITWFFVFVILALAIIRPLEEKIELFRTRIPGLPNWFGKFGHKENWTWGRIFRCLLAFLVAPAFMAWIFWSSEFWSRVGEMFFGGGYWYFVFASIAGLNIWFIDLLKKEFYEHHLKVEFWTLMLPVPFTFLYFAVLSFALHVYPYIPAERGGGDFTKEKAMLLTFGDTNAIPAGVLNKGFESRKAVILDETANMIYFAIPANGVAEIREWRQNIPATTNNPDSRPHTIFAVKREVVISERSEPW